jgi:tripartite motif-containing protein 71
VKFSHSGQLLGMAGNYGTGNGAFRFPYDAGVDDRGDLFVADNNNHRVQLLSAGGLGFQSRWGDLGAGIGEFGYPRSLAAVKGDPAGGLVVGDTSNNRVQSFGRAGNSTGVFGTNARGPGLFMLPRSVAVARDGSLSVADTFTDRIQKLSASGAPLASHGRMSTFGPAPGGSLGQFRNPYGVAVDRVSGHVYVADTGNNRVQRFNGRTWSAVGGTTFNAPHGIGVSAMGKLFVADTANNRVVRLDGSTWTPVGSGYSRPEAGWRASARRSTSPIPATPASHASTPPAGRCGPAGRGRHRRRRGARARGRRGRREGQCAHLRHGQRPHPTLRRRRRLR